MSKALVIKQLKVKVADLEIVKGVNLTLKPGELQVLMGPNGSGKSSLAYALAGHPEYQLSASSKVTLNGHDLAKLSPDERAQAGLFLAFQHPVAVPGVRVLNFLRAAHQQRFASQPKKQFASVLEFRNHLLKAAKQLQINASFLERNLNEGFSGGEKKRLEILQMFVLEPRFAVLDETDTGLDIDALKIVADGINRAQQKFQTGILLITHYQRILQYLKPDKVQVMVTGKIVESGLVTLVDKLEKTGYEQYS